MQWTLSDFFSLNDLVQRSHLKSLSSPWDCLWWFIVDKNGNLLKHTGHSNFFSFEWTTRCSFKCDARENAFWHTSQTCGFSFKWTDFMCLFMEDRSLNVRWQCSKSQFNLLPVCIRMCCFKLCCLAKDFEQKSHWNWFLLIFLQWRLCSLKLFLKKWK